MHELLVEEFREAMKTYDNLEEYMGVIEKGKAMTENPRIFRAY